MSADAGAGRGTRALIIVGRGRYEDPWHDHAATSMRVAQVLEDLGHHVEMRSAFHQTLHAAADYDLVVVNAGTGRIDPSFDGGEDEWAPAHDAFATAIREGLPVLALHQSANTFTDSPHWLDLVGGRWIPGVSFHPPEEISRFEACGRPTANAGHASPTTQGTVGFPDVVEAYDERYCNLQVSETSHVTLTTTWANARHPVAWRSGTAPAVVYDGLGHSVRSFDSPSRCGLLVAEIQWLMRAVG